MGCGEIGYESTHLLDETCLLEGREEGGRIRGGAELNVGMEPCRSQADSGKRPSSHVEKIGRVERPEKRTRRAEDEVVYSVHAID
jgi:hypothetical protein